MTAAELKASILDLAIRGKLVAQDLDDEPASELLARIAAEKAKLIREKKIKKEKLLDPIAEDEIPFELPDGWVWCRLGEVGRWGSGATPNKAVNDYFGGNIPWLLTGDLNDGHVSEIPGRITDKALRETSVHLNPAGSVLIAMYGATIGKLGILDIPATTNQACCACQVYDGVLNEYLFWYLFSQRAVFRERGEGGAQPNISKEKIVKTLFPLPPFAEQKRIVEMVEELMPLIDRYEKAEAKRIELEKALPGDLEKSILQEAFQGNLVEQQDVWRMVKLGDVCDVFTDGDWIESKDQSSAGFRLIQTGNVGEGVFLDKEQRAKFVSVNTFDRLGCTEIYPGDVLISRLPNPVGRACVVPDIGARMITAVDCTIVRFTKYVLREYFVYFASSPIYQKQINQFLTGTTRKRISRGNLSKIEIPLPSIDEQKRIVAKVDELLGAIRRLH